VTSFPFGDTMTRSQQENRSIILNMKDKRPYGARAVIHLQSLGDVGDISDGVGVSLADGTFLTVKPSRKLPSEPGVKFSIESEGFATAASAEAAGRRLVGAVLWSSISCGFPVRLDYKTHEPANVFDRRVRRGVSVLADLTAFRPFSLVANEWHTLLDSERVPDAGLLLAMEIYSSAALESSSRARFLALVSALEPLASAAPLGEDVSTFVDECEAILSKTGIDSKLRQSLSTRLAFLRNESIGQAIRRLVKTHFPRNRGIATQVIRAYDLRSSLVHSGRTHPDVDLDYEARRTAPIIRELFSALIGQALVSPSGLASIFPIVNDAR
jgi:hypothetical protein